MPRKPPPELERVTPPEYIEILSSQVEVVSDKLTEAYRAIDELRSIAYGGGTTVTYVNADDESHMVPRLLSETVSKLITGTGDMMSTAFELRRTFDFFNEAS